MLTLEEALEKITELEAKVKTLESEKTALIGKRDDLLGKLAKFKKFESYQDVDIEALLKLKEQSEKDEWVPKSDIEKQYQKDRENLNNRLAAIEAERTQEKKDREREQAEVLQLKIETAAIAAYSKGKVISPKQLFALTKDKMQFDESGNLVVEDGYKKLAIEDYVKELKENPEYQHHFLGSGANGSGSIPGANGGSAVKTNPWKKDTFNLTEQGRILKTNPALAAKLKTEAGV